ncbi:MAG: alkaline phosphatase [candidate division WOR-3 bacterium]|jgi:alkaline phosphatase
MKSKLFSTFLFLVIIFNFLFPENLVVIITDGMNFDCLSIIRKISKDPLKEISFDRFSQIFYCETTADKTYITDSAAAGTAIFTGTKTENGIVGLNSNKVEVENIVEFCQKNSILTGIITNTRVTHATPASTFAHLDNRNKEYEIAYQLSKKNIDLIMGGGIKYFEKKNRFDKIDLLKEFQKKGYLVIKDKSGLKKVTEKKVFALFSDSHLDYELQKDTTKQPTLTEMVEYGLKYLDEKAEKEKKDFFLMIESGRIDHASHYTLFSELYFELLETEKMVKTVLDFASKTNTTVILVSDHSTANPVFIGTFTDSTLHTMDSYFVKNFDNSTRENTVKSLDSFKVKFTDISEFSGEKEESSYRGDHTGSDVLGFFYSRNFKLEKIFYRNDQIFDLMKKILKD